MASVDDLYNAMNELFELVIIALEDTIDGPPTCQFLSEGPPIIDTIPCVTVWLGAPAIADTFPLQPSLQPGHRATTQGQVNLVTITTTIIRCGSVPPNSGKPPTAAQHAAVTRQTSQDLWAIWNHIGKAKKRGFLFAPKERELFFDPAQPASQEGGGAGWQIPIRTELDGYVPDIYT